MPIACRILRTCRSLTIFSGKRANDALAYQPFVARPPSNTRLKLAAPVVYGRIAFVNVKMWRRSLGAIRWAAAAASFGIPAPA